MSFITHKTATRRKALERTHAATHKALAERRDFLHRTGILIYQYTGMDVRDRELVRLEHENRDVKRALDALYRQEGRVSETATKALMSATTKRRNRTRRRRRGRSSRSAATAKRKTLVWKLVYAVAGALAMAGAVAGAKNKALQKRLAAWWSQIQESPRQTSVGTQKGAPAVPASAPAATLRSAKQRSVKQPPKSVKFVASKPAPAPTSGPLPPCTSGFRINTKICDVNEGNGYYCVKNNEPYNGFCYSPCGKHRSTFNNRVSMISSPASTSVAAAPTSNVPKPNVPSLQNIKIIPSVFKHHGKVGDFAYEIKLPCNKRTLYIFNDNEDDHSSYNVGAGNGVIRPYNRYGQHKHAPRSAGICTGKSGVGYSELTPRIQSVIDRDISEIKELLKTGHYDTVKYCCRHKDDPHTLGTGIFKVAPEVKTYIVQQIRSLSNIT